MRVLTPITGLMVAGLMLLSARSIEAVVAPCTAEALQDEVRSSLVGSIEVSTLRIVWRSSNEGADFQGYELWSRFDRRGDRLAELQPTWSCPLTMQRELRVAFDATRTYWLHLKLRDGSFRAIPVPIH